MIHRHEDGRCTISSRRAWLPGVYEDERAARLALRLPGEALERLQTEANARAGGAGGVITREDLEAAGGAK